MMKVLSTIDQFVGVSVTWFGRVAQLLGAFLLLMAVWHIDPLIIAGVVLLLGGAALDGG